MKRLLAAGFVAMLVLAAPARASVSEFGLASVSASLTTYQAGDHPDFETTFELKTDPESEPNAFGLKAPYASTRDVIVDLPPGLIGNPNAVEQCTLAQLETYAMEGGGCPNGSQVGVTKIYAYGLTQTFTEPIYMMVPPADGSAVARLGLIAGLAPTLIEAQVRSENPNDYGISAILENASGEERLVKAETALWGVPAAEGHDSERCTPEEAFHGCETSPPRPPAGSAAPFMTNPVRCGTPLEVGFAVDSYQLPGQFSAMSASLEPIFGCDQIVVSPSLSVTPTTGEAGAPTGLEAELTIPQNEAVGGLASGQVRNATVTLPEGMTIAAGAADGLVACSHEEAGFGRREAAHCPDAAKIGTLEADVPALPGPLHGAIYQRSPEAGHLFRIWLIADELGVHLKIPGEVEVDKQTGQITSIFVDNPQVAVARLELHLREGARAPLANPSSCGTYLTRWRLTPWSSVESVASESPMTIDRGCDGGGFSPRLSAGSTNPLAGAFSSFVATLTRQSREENVSGLDVTPPPGVSAKLAGVPRCEGQAAASGECPAASQVGSVIVASGPGPSPLWIPQPGKEPTAVYLSGPYRGAPLSLVVKVPAQAGPFDLGTVVTRAAIRVHPETARVTVSSDPLPRILEGVPVSYRTIQVDIDRPQFQLNPTSCKEMVVEAKATSVAGTIATPSARFQVGGCKELGFGPRLRLRLHGETNRGTHPGLTAVLKARRGDANLRRVEVALPHSEFLDQGHIRTVCTRVQFARGGCPAGSVYGHATASTPLLDRPLKGPVYLRASSHQLPDLVAALRGEIEIDAVGRIDSVRGGIRTTFEAVPDAPIGTVVLTMAGGKKGLLVNSRNLCEAPARALVELDGHNGKDIERKPLLRNSCARGSRRHKKTS